MQAHRADLQACGVDDEGTGLDAFGVGIPRIFVLHGNESEPHWSQMESKALYGVEAVAVPDVADQYSFWFQDASCK